MLNILGNFAHKAELRESKDEILLGELVRGMARANYVTTGFWANNDFQRVRFKAIGDPVLSNVYLTLNRLTGQGLLSGAVFGSKASLTVTAEVKNYLSDPDDLIAMYKTDLANMFKMPVLGGIKLNHELNSVFATTTEFIQIDDYVFKGDAGVQKLTALLNATIGKTRDAVKPYKKG
jgi:hypothetical protein